MLIKWENLIILSIFNRMIRILFLITPFNTNNNWPQTKKIFKDLTLIFKNNKTQILKVILQLKHLILMSILIQTQIPAIITINIKHIEK